MRASGHDVALFISPVARLRSWAQARGIPTYAELDIGLAERLNDIDHLFSIVNGTILPPAILAAPRGVAINYHNSLLPRYAGVNASSWAILAGEARHGVTWHIMSTNIDAGPVVRQVELPIEASDTAGSLNDRCRRAALAELPGLLAELTSGDVVSRPQTLGARRYFPANRRAHGGGVVRWSLTAATIDRVVRAHHVGDVTNFFGLPKFHSGAHVVVIRRLERTTRESGARPGTVIATDAGLEVATATENVVIHAAQLLSGRILRGPEIAQFLGLTRGRGLPSEPADTIVRLDAILATIAPHERWCAQELSRAREVATHQSHGSAATGARAATLEITARHRTEIQAWLDRRVPWSSVIIATLDLVLHGLGFDLATAATAGRSAGLETWLDPYGPLLLEHDLPDQPVADFIVRAAERIRVVEARALHARDLPLRWKIPHDAGACISIDVGCDARPHPRHQLRIKLDAEATRVHISGRSPRAELAEPDHIATALATALGHAGAGHASVADLTRCVSPAAPLAKRSGRR
jgi:methionyl-tRNA formyltransferase